MGVSIILSSTLFARTSTTGADTELEIGEAPSVKGYDTVLPHESQNRAPVLNSVLQEGQTTVRREPHESQNLASSRLSFPQFEQVIYPSRDIYVRRLFESTVGTILGEMGNHHNMVSEPKQESSRYDQHYLVPLNR